MTRKERLKQRNEKIKREFEDMVNRKHLDLDYVLEKLSDQYHLEERTIYLILKGYGHYRGKGC